MRPNVVKNFQNKDRKILKLPETTWLAGQSGYRGSRRGRER